MKQNLVKIGILSVFLIAMLSLSGVYGHGAEPADTAYEGGTALIPFVENAPSIDGVLDQSVYSSDGLLSLPQIETTINLAHNGSYLFVLLTFEGTGFGGIGFKTTGGHDEAGTSEEEPLTYVIGGVLSNGTVKADYYSATDEFRFPALLDSELNLQVAGTEANDVTTLEFAIQFTTGNAGHGDEEGTELFDLGSLFFLTVVLFENDTAFAPPASLIGSIPALGLRQGENVDEIKEILANEANWIDYILFPLILLVAASATVWVYWPKQPINSK